MVAAEEEEAGMLELEAYRPAVAVASAYDAHKHPRLWGRLELQPAVNAVSDMSVVTDAFDAHMHLLR